MDTFTMADCGVAVNQHLNVCHTSLRRSVFTLTPYTLIYIIFEKHTIQAMHVYAINYIIIINWNLIVFLMIDQHRFTCSNKEFEI